MKTILVSAFKENRNNILLATIIFLSSAIIGYLFFDKDNQVIQSFFEQLGGVAADIKSHDSVSYMIFRIFYNNLFIAFIMMVSGIIFGIIPIVILFLNGLFMGFLLKMMVLESGHSLSFFLAGILPHGVLELPAIVISAAFGIQLGFTLFKLLIGKIKPTRDHVVLLIKKQLSVILALTIILFIAAIIESTVTVYLLTKFYS